MKNEVTSAVGTAQLFIAVAGGIALYLVPQDAKNMLAVSQRTAYVVAVAFFVTSLLLFLFKSYETVGISLVVTMTLIVVNYARGSVEQIIADSSQGKSFMLYLSYYDGLCWGLIWFVPFLICITIRLFATGEWDTPEHRQNFCRFYKLSGRAFYVYYGILFLVCFLFIRRVDFYGARQMNLMPFIEIKWYLTNLQTGLQYLAGNLFFFMPFGFFISVRKAAMPWWKKLALVAVLSIGIELVQFAFNTGYADTDDVLLNCAGFFAGVFIKNILDRIRSFVTGGGEKAITYIAAKTVHTSYDASNELSCT